LWNLLQHVIAMLRSTGLRPKVLVGKKDFTGSVGLPALAQNTLWFLPSGKKRRNIAAPPGAYGFFGVEYGISF
jgi:hypothetical protein